MTLTIALVAAAGFSLSGGGEDASGDERVAAAEAVGATSVEHPVREVAAGSARSEDAARAYLKLVEAGDAEAAYAAAAESFRTRYKFDLFELGVALYRNNTGGAQKRSLVAVEVDIAPTASAFDQVEILTFDTLMLDGDRHVERIVMGREGGTWRLADFDSDEMGDE